MRVLGYVKQKKDKTNLVIALTREVYQYGRMPHPRLRFRFRNKPAVGTALYQDRFHTELAWFPRGIVFEAGLLFNWLRGGTSGFNCQHEGEELWINMGLVGIQELLKALLTGHTTVQNNQFFGRWTFYNASGNCWVQPFIEPPETIQPIPADWLADQ